MSKGGSKTVTNNDPWVGAQPYLKESLGMAQQVAHNPAKFYPGQTYLDPNAQQLGAWGSRLGYVNNVFGAPAGMANPATPQLGLSPAGTPNTQAGGPGGLIRPPTPGGLNFGGLTSATDQLLAGGPAWNLGNATGGAFANQLGQFGGPSSLDTGIFTPQFGNAGILDATSAYQRLLSGQPDYAAVDQNANLANEQLIQGFQQNVLPGIAGRGIISGSDTGAIKQLATALPNLATNLQANVLNAREGERQRALGMMGQAAQQVAQGGLQAGQLGLQGALGQANLQGDYRNQLLGLGGLAGNFAGQAGQNMATGANLWGNAFNLGQTPANVQEQYGNFLQQPAQNALNESMNRWDFAQNQPRDIAQWYANLAQGFGGLGGSSTQRGSQSTGAGDVAGGLLGLALKA